MTAPEVSQWVLTQFQLRIEDHMSRYVAEKMRDGLEIPVIGGDTRTGVPRRQVITFGKPSQTLSLF